jgi:4-amino-4-deoxy-L-arabinose transferase-like glycosyltransferase
MQTRALGDFGEMSLNRAMRVYGPVGDLSVVNGRYYPSKAPFLSFAAVPVYWVLRAGAGGQIGAVPEIPLIYFSRLFLTVLPTLLSLVLVRRFLSEYVESAMADAVTITYALGTLAYSYSLLFMSHQTTASLLFGAFYCIWRSEKRPQPWLHLALAGVLAGLAVAAEYTSALCATLLAVYVWLTYRRREGVRSVLRVLPFALGALPSLALLMAYHSATFGGPFETGYRYLADAAYQPWHLGGFLGIRTPRPQAFIRSLFSPLRGLLALSPVLVLGFVGLASLWSERTKRRELEALSIFSGLLVLGYFYFTASFSYESWGWTTGPRHLTGLVPFLLLPLALVLTRSWATRWRGAFAGLILASVVITGSLTSVNYIPDDVSDGFWALSIPLITGGYLVPTIVNPLGMTNPWAGLAILLFVLGAASVACGIVIRGSNARVQLGLFVLVVALCIGTHRLALADSPADRAALALLKHDWLAPPGVRWTLWSSSGH